MKRLPVPAMILLLFVTVVGTIQGRREQNELRDKLNTLTGRVFRSDTGESIAYCYLELVRGHDSDAGKLTFQFPSAGDNHFNLTTDHFGNYAFNKIPAGTYSVFLSAWFPKETDVPCQHPRKAKTADHGSVIVGWQYKSDAFVEVVTIKGFSLGTDQNRILHQTIKDFDLFCK